MFNYRQIWLPFYDSTQTLLKVRILAGNSEYNSRKCRIKYFDLLIIKYLIAKLFVENAIHLSQLYQMFFLDIYHLHQ